uniref:ATP synthase subunit a n=1 Tax=Sphaerirostris lanceoides TaxID=2169581 RepID=A0A6M8YDX6_9BILA|nr:ATP synthase F0 subunit 6 [Sphaerirostris lanceoides]
MGVINLMVLWGLGVYLRDLGRESLGVLGEKGECNLVSLVVGVGVLCWWAVDNLGGLFLGTSISVVIAMVMVVGVMAWIWGEVVKVVSSGVELYCGHYMVPGLRGVLVLVLPFMELMSVVIRPLTLSVRLSTNITSGHVLLIMASLFASAGWLMGVGVGVVGWLLGLLEVFVAVLQGGIFAMLVIIYMD